MRVNEDRISLLVERASKVAGDMQKATAGKQPADGAGTNVASLQGIANMLTDLSGDIVRRRQAMSRFEVALERISTLKVRSATQLIEQGDWKKLCAELQSVAEEALRPE